MPSQKLIRCEVRRSSGARPSIRYIPMEIYGLWEHLMVSKHGFQVDNRGASLWIDVEESPEVTYSEPSYERVTEVTLFVYSEPDGMFTRVCRYFPSEEYPALKRTFLSHYAGRDGHELGPQLREKEGIWIKRSGVAAATL
jgi:hypothetical protein